MGKVDATRIEEKGLDPIKLYVDHPSLSTAWEQLLYYALPLSLQIVGRSPKFVREVGARSQGRAQGEGLSCRSSLSR